ncbi:MAG: hypothetical protein Q9M89_00705 [Persephonella sp.]|nr:hypothetical protein [Persephonella sp.]
MNRILISKDVYDRDITKKFIKDVARQILKELGLDQVELSITLTDNDTIKTVKQTVERQGQTY